MGLKGIARFFNRHRCGECGKADDHWHVIDDVGEAAIVYKGAYGPPVLTAIRRELRRLRERMGRAIG